MLMILNNKNNNINEIIKGFGFSINTFIDKAKELKVLNINNHDYIKHF